VSLASPRHGFARSFLCAALLLCSCSLVVRPGTEEIACRVETGSDPCRDLDPPQQCSMTDGRVGVCRSVGTPEICGNGVDEDLDGTVDEGIDETCNGRDDDCDGVTDEGAPAAPGVMDLACDGMVDDDCDGAVDEDAVERCDGVDNDCDDVVDEGAPPNPLRDDIPCNLIDDDCDGFADEGVLEVCDALDNDCDGSVDEEPLMGPPPPEVCNLRDDDCDGSVDEDFVERCDLVDNDCDGRVDEEAPPDPGRTEACNDIDDDCDGMVDEGFVEVCDRADNDCDGRVDEDAPADPSREEFCNGIDDDCDGEVDNSSATEICNGRDEDCDTIVDEGAAMDPTRPETCNSVDDDCDGTTDEGVEVCNGVDDDCDGRIDLPAGPDLCPEGNICFEGECEPPSCDNGGVTCDADQVCNPLVSPAACAPRPDPCPGEGCGPTAECRTVMVAGMSFETCVELQPFGATCSVDAECVSGTSCVDLAAIGMSGRQCLASCCSDDDCPEGGVCRTHPETDARLCVPSALGFGATAVGEACGAASECVSGYCDGTCRRACTRQGDCASTGNACVATGHVLGFRGFACGEPAGSGMQDDDCEMSGDADDARCRYRMCDEFGIGRICVEPCGDNGDCGAGEECRPYAVTEDDGSAEFRTFMRTCRPVGATYQSSPRRYIQNGGGCDGNHFRCGSRFCRDSGCAVQCCTSDDCGAGEACEPVRVREPVYDLDRYTSYCVTRD